MPAVQSAKHPVRRWSRILLPIVPLAATLAGIVPPIPLSELGARLLALRSRIDVLSRRRCRFHIAHRLRTHMDQCTWVRSGTIRCSSDVRRFSRRAWSSRSIRDSGSSSSRTALQSEQQDLSFGTCGELRVCLRRAQGDYLAKTGTVLLPQPRNVAIGGEGTRRFSCRSVGLSWNADASKFTPTLVPMHVSGALSTGERVRALSMGSRRRAHGSRG